MDKMKVAKQVEELERQVRSLQAEIDDYNRLRDNKEAFALRCFEAGVHSKKTDNTYKAWLEFKATEL